MYSSLRKFLRHVPGLRPDARAFGEALPTHVRRAKRRMSPYEKKHWMPWSEVVGKVDALVARITKATPLRQIARETMVDALLLALYVYAEAPRRNEYRTMRTTDDGTSNYVDWRRKQFVFRQYKTAHAYGEQRVDIPARLMTVLRLHRKRCGRTAYLLGDRPWSTSTFSNRVRAASKRVLGKYIGSRFLRKMYATAQFSKRMERMQKLNEAVRKARETLRRDQETVSKNMGNNLLQLHRSYIKAEVPTEPKAEVKLEPPSRGL